MVKLDAVVIEVACGGQFKDGKDRIRIKVEQANGIDNTLTIMQPGGLAIGDKLSVVISY